MGITYQQTSLQLWHRDTSINGGYADYFVYDENNQVVYMFEDIESRFCYQTHINIKTVVLLLRESLTFIDRYTRNEFNEKYEAMTEGIHKYRRNNQP